MLKDLSKKAKQILTNTGNMIKSGQRKKVSCHRCSADKMRAVQRAQGRRGAGLLPVEETAASLNAAYGLFTKPSTIIHKSRERRLK